MAKPKEGVVLLAKFVDMFNSHSKMTIEELSWAKVFKLPNLIYDPKYELTEKALDEALKGLYEDGISI